MDNGNYIARELEPEVVKAAAYYRVIIITGPRQVGKTTMCRHAFAEYKYYNFEDLALREMAEADMKGVVDSCGSKVIIDEVQRLPQLMSYVQIAVDANESRRFVLTGSSNFALLQSISQSLAGRAALFTLLPFAISELRQYASATPTDELMFNGFYPSIVAKGFPVNQFYRNYYSTYVERDVRQLLNVRNLDCFQTFMRLCAGRAGTEFNASSIAVEAGVSSPTVKEWLSILQASYIVFKLPPYYANISKRLVKTPKIYFYDTGLLCFLLDIEEPRQLTTHPLRGSVFENLAVAELLKHRLNADKTNNLSYYRENSGREVDIVQTEGGLLRLWEVKSSKTYRNEFMKNISYLKALLGNKVTEAKLIYDGEPCGTQVVNVRDMR